jgi:hypothetical protein
MEQFMVLTTQKLKLQNQFDQQTDYLLGFHYEWKYGLDNVVIQRWPKNSAYILEDDAYESPFIIYNKEANALVLYDTISKEV